jgi:hypothetical protein
VRTFLTAARLTFPAAEWFTSGGIIDTDSFVMKGEHITPRSRWQGNPAASVPGHDGGRPH